MLKVLGAVSAPGRAGRANEDGYGSAATFAWVIDGATGLGDEQLIDGPSDAAWLTANMDAAFRAHAERTADPAELLALAAADCERRFRAERRREPKERYEIPTAAVLLAAFGAEGITIADLGDCAVFVGDGEGLTRIGGTEVGRALEQENARKMMATGGGRSADVLAFLRLVRNQANTPEGYAIFAPEADSAAAARIHRHAAPAGEALFVTDGYEAALEDYGIYPDAGGLFAAARRDVRHPLDALREVEENDPDCRRFPRFKKSDDATAMLVRFGPVQ